MQAQEKSTLMHIYKKNIYMVATFAQAFCQAIASMPKAKSSKLGATAKQGIKKATGLIKLKPAAKLRTRDSITPKEFKETFLHCAK